MASPWLREWIPVWSVPAAMRAVRAAVVVAGLFAFTDKVIGNVQMATFAAFGGFATLGASLPCYRWERAGHDWHGRPLPRRAAGRDRGAGPGGAVAL